MVRHPLAAISHWRRLAVWGCAIAMLSIGSQRLGAQDSKKPDPLTSELTRILETQAQAWNDGDLERFMGAYWKSEHLTFSGGGHTTRGWQATLDRYRRNYGDQETMGELTFSELEVTPLGSDAALMLGRFQLLVKGQKSGGNFSLVWRKLDGEWKIIHDHSSSDEPREPPAEGSSRP